MNTPINFKIAKLLKEKGYNKPHNKIYSVLGELWKSHYQSMKNDNPKNGSCCTAPTIAEVVMWLYEKHGIWISVTSISQESWQCHMCRKGDSLGKCYLEDFYTPTEAYEAAIEYTLNNLT